MFWGVTIMPGRRYTQTVEKSYHISMAAIEIPSDPKGPQKRAQVMLVQNKTKFLLCNLDTEHQNQTNLDLVFTEGEEVTFYLNGDGVVHLTGYLLHYEDDDYDDDSSDEEIETKGDSSNAKRKQELSPIEAKKLKVDNSKAKPEQPKVNGSSVKVLDDSDIDMDEGDEDELGFLDNLDEDEDEEEDDEEEDDEEDDEEEEEEDEEVFKPKTVQAKPLTNGQVAKPQSAQKPQQAQKNQQKQGPGQQQQNKPGQNQNQNKFGNNQNKFAGNQSKFGGNQNKFGGNQNKNSPQGQNKFGNKPQGGNQQKFGGQNKFGNKKPGPFTPNQKDDAAQKTLSGGLICDDINEGHGPVAKKGKFVHVRYVGKLSNNKEFDRSGNKPFSFRLGAGEVIKGWDVGLEGMKVGGKRKIVIPPSMGYGTRPSGPIPGNSTLNFEVELVSVS